MSSISTTCWAANPSAPNHILIGKNIADKVVLVTGAGGSIGSELCRQILAARPTTLVLIDQSEFALYEIHQELTGQARAAMTTVELAPVLASVRDETRMREVLACWKPHTVYHAAAYKHVPLVEDNPVEGIRNNTMGTLSAARVAAELGVSDFVLISTDKAVRPTNVMGASKRLAEMSAAGTLLGSPQHLLLHGAVWQCAGLLRLRGAQVPAPDP